MKPNCTVLIADDDSDDQKMIADALSALPFNFEIVYVHNGLEVMDYLLMRRSFANVKAPPDLIFLDLNMPLFDGFEVLKGIRIQRILASIPVYVITVSRNPDDEKKAQRLGATGFHSKGHNAEELKETIRKIIFGHHPWAEAASD